MNFFITHTYNKRMDFFITHTFGKRLNVNYLVLPKLVATLFFYPLLVLIAMFIGNGASKILSRLILT